MKMMKVALPNTVSTRAEQGPTRRKWSGECMRRWSTAKWRSNGGW